MGRDDEAGEAMAGVLVEGSKVMTGTYCRDCNEPLPYDGICKPCNRQMEAEIRMDEERRWEEDAASDEAE